MKLTPSMKDFILHWGDMGSRWGLNRSVAQVHALLHISPTPLTAEEIATTLSLARSNISTGLKELTTWRMITTSRQLGDRREYYTAVGDIYDLVEAVIAARREREYVPTLNALRDILDRADSDGTPPEVKTRLAETVETMQALDGWYTNIASLPRATQLSLIRAGARLGSLVTGVSKKKKKKKLAEAE